MKILYSFPVIFFYLFSPLCLADNGPSNKTLTDEAKQILTTALTPWINATFTYDATYTYFDNSSPVQYLRITYAQDLVHGIVYKSIKSFKDPQRKALKSGREERWDGTQFISIDRVVSDTPGSRYFESTGYEYPGLATIDSRPFLEWFDFDSLWIIPVTGENLYQAILQNKFETNVGFEALESGEKCITFKSPYFKIFIDPKNNALKRLDQYMLGDPSGPSIGRHYDILKIDSNKFPNVLSIDTYLPKSKKFVHIDIKVDENSVVFNNVPPSKFDLTLPVGCQVTDAINKKVYRITGLENVDANPNDVSHLLDQIVQKAKDQQSRFPEK